MTKIDQIYRFKVHYYLNFVRGDEFKLLVTQIPNNEQKLGPFTNQSLIGTSTAG